MSTGSHREFWLALLCSTHTDETISIATTGFFKGELGERCEKPKPTQLKTIMGRICWSVFGVGVASGDIVLPLTQKFSGSVCLCRTSWARQPKMWKWELVFALHSSGCPPGAALPGLWGWEGAGVCLDGCVEAACAAALGGAMEDVAAADAQSHFPSWWHHCAHCQQVISAVVGGCASSDGSQECLTCVPAFL